MASATKTQAALVSVSSEVRRPTGSSRAQRIPALDFTRGALVLIMVLYHWINYFIGPQWAYYEYLRFLTPSFIFIAGFMISNVYLSKYAATDLRLSRRLFTRGLKLMAVFVVLNLARTVIAPGLGAGFARNQVDIESIFEIFVSGNLSVACGKLVSFTILVPISYMLMLSGVLMLPYRFCRYTFHFATVLLLVSILLLELTGRSSPYLEMIAMGMLGLMSGFLPIRTINNLVRYPYVLGFAYLGYTIAIRSWNVPFPLLVVGVPLSLAMIYSVGASARESGTIRHEVILLGKYSLFGYLSQIAILQVMSAVFHRIHLTFITFGLSFIAAFVLTIASVEMVDRARAKAVTLDRLYRAVFA